MRYAAYYLITFAASAAATFPFIYLLPVAAIVAANKMRLT